MAHAQDHVQGKSLTLGLIPHMAAIDMASRFGQVGNELGKKHDGTGIGLPLTQGLVELHGGSFDIHSVKGQGTTVTVRFPPERTVTP